MTVLVRLNRLPSLAGNLRGAERRIQDAVGPRIAAKARGRARVDTGEMRAATRYAGGGVVGARAPHSGFLDMGTRFVPADRWFTGSAEEEAAALGATAETVVRGLLGA